MVDLPNAVAVTVLVSIVPTILGTAPLWLMSSEKLDRNRFAFAGIAVGVLFALFVDLINDASGLGASLGIRSPTVLIVHVLSFGLVLLSFSRLDSSARGGPSVAQLRPVYLVAVAIALHSIAEGIVIGYDLRTAGISATLGTVVQAFSFALHKAGEGFALSVLFFGGMRSSDKLAVGLTASVPSILGTIAALFGVPGIGASYFFAGGAGAIIFIINRLLPLGLEQPSRLSLASTILVGFLFIYIAGLIHFIEI